MVKVEIEFGGGHVPPTVKGHLQAVKKAQASKTQFGGGHVPPAVKTHLRRAMKSQIKKS